jgi:CRP-like cAMP-binding protein
MDKLWYLSRISLFDTLPQEDLIEIDRIAPMKHLPNGTMVQTPDLYREGLFIVKVGKMRMYKLNEEGKQFTAGILGAGNMFGEIDSFSFGTKGIYIETMEETLLCSLWKDQFESFLSERPQLAMKLLKELSERLKERDEMLEKLALGNIRDRVLHLLVKLCERFGVKEEGGLHRIDMALTHQEVANMIGATRESVTVVLRDLMKDKIIETGRKTICIHLNKARAELEHGNLAL